MKASEFVTKCNEILNMSTQYKLGTFCNVKNGSRLLTDCSGLIKGILWGYPSNGRYASNGVPDHNANTIISKCNNVSTDFSKIIAGAFVWIDGHIGVYIGNGHVIESTAAWESKVIMTNLSNISGSGCAHSRKWDKWGISPYLDFSIATTKPPTNKRDDRIEYRVHMESLGWGIYTANNEANGTTGESRRIEAIQINPKKYTIKAKAHIQSIGWVDYGIITKDTIIGTVGKSKRLEAICLEGNLEYRVYIEGTGWTQWTKADGIATLGTVGMNKRIEAIQIKAL